MNAGFCSLVPSINNWFQVWDNLWPLTTKYSQGVGKHKEDPGESEEEEEGKRGGVGRREWSGALQVPAREVLCTCIHVILCIKCFIFPQRLIG